MITAAEYLATPPFTKFAEIDADTVQLFINLAYSVCGSKEFWGATELTALQLLTAHYLDSYNLQDAAMTGVGNAGFRGEVPNPPTLPENDLMMTTWGMQYEALRKSRASFGVI